MWGVVQDKWFDAPAGQPARTPGRAGSPPIASPDQCGQDDHPGTFVKKPYDYLDDTGVTE